MQECFGKCLSATVNGMGVNLCHHERHGFYLLFCDVRIDMTSVGGTLSRRQVRYNWGLGRSYHPTPLTGGSSSIRNGWFYVVPGCRGYGAGSS